MKNKLILTLSLLLTITPSTYMCAHEGWLEYLASYIWSKQQEQQQPTTESQSAPQQRPQPSAPPYEPQRYPQQQTQQTITYAQREHIKRDVEIVIDELFATSQQERNAQREINEIKKLTITCISEKSRNCKTVQELRNATNNALTDCLASYVAKNARLLYLAKAAKASGTPAFSPAYLADQIESEIYVGAINALVENKRNGLGSFVGSSLDRYITAKVAHDFPTPKKASPAIAPSNPVADDIYEVYLHEKAKRYEQSIEKISQAKTHRETECSVCMDDFGGAKKRATLACGHSI